MSKSEREKARRSNAMRISRKKLIDAMKEKNINHRELAELAGITRMTVHNVKRGHNCSAHTGECIANALDVPVEKLIEK